MAINTVRFFNLNPDQHVGYKAVLVPDNDILPLYTFNNAAEIYRDYEKVIVSAIISPELLSEIKAITECDPLSIEAVHELDIADSYCGKDYTDEPVAGLFWYFPELSGKHKIGIDPDTGQDIMMDIAKRVEWSSK